ncbi:ArnT family glycosyltransferase [Planctomicrobium piriforme]|uniref:Dolichyl-phosphate-mannose-protein mannosyltransferase n=1 Tax=Planctomicrobium piriforme TaxID=1576369 RepID=A0A1I3GM61_9PLAN|nr:glycosyltransferase family 39 protein [Planctomicrobium piriforme]SFI24575.1 Dolichyl-phosphate-mannose-protein mannosyltransferase [Planctomicrobium piriforme]
MIRSDWQLNFSQASVITFGLLVPVHVFLLAWIACRYSPAADESAHLVAGLRIWTEGKFDVYQVNPPLVKAVAALPVLLDPPQINWQLLTTKPGDRPEWLLGLSYLREHRPRFRWDMVLARWACIPFSVLGLAYCFRWGAALFGPSAGLLAASLWCFSPNILGNAALITPDVAATALGMATLFHFRGWLLQPGWRNAFLVGVLLGLTELTKFTWVILYVLLPVLWAGQVLFSRTRFHGETSLRQQGLQLLLLLLVSLDVLNAGYGFQQTLRPLGEFEFVSESLGGGKTQSAVPDTDMDASTAPHPDPLPGVPGRGGNVFRSGCVSALPVPVPAAWVQGIDLQRRDFEGGWRPLYSYLNGEQRLGGWWYYYLAASWMKSPLGSWLIAGAAVWGLWRSGLSISFRMELALLLIPAAAILVLISSQTGFSRYFRYLLPAFPFVYVALSGVWSPQVVRAAPGAAWCAGVGLLAVVVGSLSVYPQSLAFFNTIAGGPQQGHLRLLDANIDWGQDLYALKDWQNAHPEAPPLYVAYSGVADPELFDIATQDVVLPLGDEMFAPGWYAVSVNRLHGYDDPGSPWTRFLPLTPVGRAGYSILIYHLAEVGP